MPDLSNLDDYLRTHADDFEAELFELLRIPSVSTDSQYGDEIQRAASWVADHLGSRGLAAEIIPTEGNPIVYAESEPVPRAPTVLVYGHYDVQPPDPLDLWKTPPFEPTVRGGNVYARGATDDKGQMLTHVKSAEAWLKTVGKLPVQLKFLIEGEEEVGSESLERLLGEAADKLACDIVVVSDCSQFGPGKPAITYGLRGIAYFELRLRGPNQDLHSGTFGGGVINPVNALTRLLAALVDDQGRVQIPGFYEDVIPLTEQERRQFADLPFDEEAFRKRLDVETLGGEAGFTTLERRWARPTCDINGIWGGYQGEGAKTVLPSQAGAKVSFRLVPNQNPAKVGENLRAMLAQLCPAGVQLEVIDMHGAPGVVVPLDSPYVRAATRAIHYGFGCDPVFIREGGSIPIVTAFKENLGADTLLLGWGLDDDNTHAPNEKFCLADFHRAIKASAALWSELASVTV